MKRLLIIGGGPAGLYFGISMKLRDPLCQITVLERNKADDTFGWGVVLSDETLDNLKENDPVSAEQIRHHFAYWDDINVVRNGHSMVSTGHGFCGIGRKKLLQVLQLRATELKIDLQFQSEVHTTSEYKDDYDVVVACDGLNSTTRNEYAEHFKPDIQTLNCPFVWLGTQQKFDDAFTFIFEQTDKGWVWAHAYQFDDDTATFIVECSQATFDAYGFGDLSQAESIAICEQIFMDHLGGHSLMTNASHIRGSAWIHFPRVLCEHWSFENVVLLGDASATAHFSIGSGTKLALESAISLADNIASPDALPVALARYEESRLLEVLRLQSAARNSVEWFEDIERYLPLDPVQFNYSLLTRSQRISHENLRERDAKWLQVAERWFQNQAVDYCQSRQTGGTQLANESVLAVLATGASSRATLRTPMFAPFRLRDMFLENRVVVSPMAQYKAVDGCPTDWHFVHYAERAKGGAGLVYVEMTCVSAEGRITPGCPGLYHDSHTQEWKRLTDFVHRETPAKICCQIGHAGRKASTQLGWQEMDAPLSEGNWPILSASSIAWSPDNQVPSAITHEQMQAIKVQFVDATRRADQAGFDMVEMHAAHGYLLSSFISPVSNIRSDEFGGSLENRLRYPLEVFAAMRQVLASEKPMSVRISASDWLGDLGVTPEESVIIARYFSEAGADIIDVSAGQTSGEAEPRYGRMFQTPFSDRIRNENSIRTMAVGNIYEPDHVNSILMAGRADLVCLARPHLSDPYWTLHAGAEIGDRECEWPLPYQPGRDQLWRLADRAKEQANAQSRETPAAT